MVPGPGEASSSKGVFHLVRTLSGRSVTNDSQTDLGAQPLERTQSGTSTSSKRKLGVGDKLLKLTQDLPLKFRRNNKSGLASPRVTAADLSTTNDLDHALPAGQVRHGKMLSTVTEHTESDGTLSQEGTSTETPSPVTLAKRLRDLIDPLPFPTFSAPIKPPKLARHDRKGRPITPPSASPINDNKLIALLSSATFMNGSKTGESPRPSIWDLLENLGAPPHGFPESQSTGDGTGDGSNADPPDPRYSGTSTVMVYSPLIPGQEDIVELGELIPVTVEEEVIQDVTVPTSWTSMWPLSLVTGWTQLNPKFGVMEGPSDSGFSGDFYVHSDVISVDTSGRKVRVKTTSAWVPSTTKVSFQVMWWGYRLWLPPPVMAILSDHTLEAAKRASMIATALAWFFNNLPVNVFPVQVRPALLLMQRIVPYLGYIAAFISWSWSTVKSYDLGYGVTLTATWLLPIALIPGTWFERDVPKSPTQSPPAGLPSPTPTTPTSPPSETPKNPPVASPPSTTPAPSQPTPNPPTPQPKPPATVSIVPSPPNQQPVTPPNDPDVPCDPGPVVLGPTPLSSPNLLAKKFFSFSVSKGPSIPVPPPPIDLPPIPPVPTPRTPVHVSSSLGEELLHAPALRPVPLPAEPVGTTTRDKKDKKRRIKSFLGHN